MQLSDSALAGRGLRPCGQGPSAQRRYSLDHFEDVEKVHFQLIDAVIELVQLLASIIEIFFKRRANGCAAPLSSNRDVALRRAAEGERLEHSRSGISPAEAAACD
jgi:hypothetical protein